MDLKEFRNTIFSFYLANRREFPWRQTTDPYHILVSEIMLQQTQAERVTPKYEQFISKFPTWEALAAAPTAELLLAWQGLGYNRRALALRATAERVVSSYQGKLPLDEQVLRSFPGIGPYTAGALCAFAGNQPVCMIETNIRRVYLHFFFTDQSDVADRELLPLITSTVDQENPREWYYALMDYGAWLAKQIPNPNRKSKHYTKQSKFEGSQRQLRGSIIRCLLAGPQELADIVQYTSASEDRIVPVLESLVSEGFIRKHNSSYLVA